MKKVTKFDQELIIYNIYLWPHLETVIIHKNFTIVQIVQHLF